MKHHIFTSEEKRELERNSNISKVINSNVEYTEEFKQKVLREHEKSGKTAKQIFSEAGIPDWFNCGKYATKCLVRWKFQKKYPKLNKRGRPKFEFDEKLQGMTINELLQRVMYLERKIESLKKIKSVKK